MVQSSYQGRGGDKMAAKKWQGTKNQNGRQIVKGKQKLNGEGKKL